ncbi:MAG: aspartate/glutamate racemase family protein [Actinobacteria bacterium]|nr:aspartate/glutamate racemase family protein [Actinomycetota bacterium]
MRIHVVTPVVTSGLSTAAHFEPYARSGTHVTQGDIVRGPATIESHFDEVLAIPDTVRLAAEAESSGASAIVIDCMTDPGLAAVREVTSIPVLGPAQTAMHVAAMLAMNFSVITASEAVLPAIDALVSQYGLRDKLCSLRSIDIPVHELGEEKRVGQALCAQALLAVEVDGAHSIILGCTGMMGWAERIGDHLAVHGHEGIPVLDPVVTAFKVAEALVDLGLTPSRRTYPRPLRKELLGFDEVVLAVRLDEDDR